MKKIVVIEDNAEMCENIKELLELSNYSVRTAKDGVEGVQLIEHVKPDLVLCDIMMPELDGYGVLSYLSKYPDTRGIPFIFLTAKSEKNDFRKGMSLGADDYISKPFQQKELLDAISTRLMKKAQLEEIIHSSNQLSELKKTISGFSELKKLVENFETKILEKREYVYKNGDVPEFLYFLESGHVRSFRVSEEDKELVTEIHGSNHFFGYTELLSGNNYSEYSMTIEKSKITCIPKSDFENLLMQDRDVSNTFIKLLAGNVIEREKKLVTLAYNTVRKRVADSLIKLYENYKFDSEDVVEIKVSRDEIASMVGTATASVIRILSEFKDDGLILSKGATITILNAEKLRNNPY